MSTVARVLGVSRSNLIERTNKPSKPRGAYRKPKEVAPLAEMRPIIDQRPTYGYRRVTALLNRQRRVDGMVEKTHREDARPKLRGAQFTTSGTRKPERGSFQSVQFIRVRKG